MTYLKRLLALCMAALLLCPAAGAEEFVQWIFGDSEPTATPAPTAALDWADWDSLGEEAEIADLPELTPSPTDDTPAASLEDDGMLRVWLRSLGAPEALNLTLSGSYAVEGDRGFWFSKDASVTLTQEGGEVWLSVDGLTLDMGAALTLTRHLDGWGQAGGIYIAESEKPNLYCGDLSVAATESGLRAVLTIHVEDYLKGVVAYEMSDSFPLEALKAQAVAARTYALQRKWAAGKRFYDLVDTTSDQVYKGYDPEYANVIEAVDSTRGLVGIYDGRFATCYYSASNGGQTALAGQLLGDTSADGYLDMRDDPYDLENTHSLENDITITAHCEGSAALREMLVNALEPVMTAAGFAKGQWDFDSIANIRPVSPRFEGSRLYDELSFDLKVRVSESALATATPAPTPEASAGTVPESSDEAEPSATVTPEPTATASPAPMMDAAPTPERWVTLVRSYRVTLPVFDDIKDGLSLGLNSADCELISVERQEGLDGSPAFRLVMRRFGHGVGMSQRGAQQMAGAHEMTFRQILEFYYPGMSIERMAWPESTLISLEAAGEPIGAARPKPTPLPTPAPLPELKEGERYATVTATTLNLREKPTTASRVVDILDHGRRVIVSGDADADGWVPVHTGDAEGFVKEEYLE